MKLTKKVFDEILHDYQQGPSLHKVLKSKGIFSGDFWNYCQENPSEDTAYMRAQAAKAEKYAEEILEISDEDDDPQRARNRIDARKWYASKIKPSKFGDKIDLNINQTVDIGLALKDAQTRVLRSVQPIDTTSHLLDQQTGYEPVVLPKPAVEGDANKKTSDDDDIYS